MPQRRGPRGWPSFVKTSLKSSPSTARFFLNENDIRETETPRGRRGMEIVNRRLALTWNDDCVPPPASIGPKRPAHTSIALHGKGRLMQSSCWVMSSSIQSCGTRSGCGTFSYVALQDERADPRPQEARSLTELFTFDVSTLSVIVLLCRVPKSDLSKRQYTEGLVG